MAECKIYKNGEVILCDDLHEVQDPGETVRFSEKRLERYCYYCLGTPRVRKIGHKAIWSGTTPKWCPRGRGDAT